MKIVEGNSYVCLKEWKDVNGHTVPCGAICHASKDCLLYGYNSKDIYCQVEPLDDYEEYFTLYEESPYNQSRRDLREKYAGLAMQGFLSSGGIPTKTSDPKAARAYLAKTSIQIADVLIEALEK